MTSGYPSPWISILHVYFVYVYCWHDLSLRGTRVDFIRKSQILQRPVPDPDHLRFRGDSGLCRRVHKRQGKGHRAVDPDPAHDQRVISLAAGKKTSRSSRGPPSDSGIASCPVRGDETGKCLLQIAGERECYISRIISKPLQGRRFGICFGNLVGE